MGLRGHDGFITIMGVCVCVCVCVCVSHLTAVRDSGVSACAHMLRINACLLHKHSSRRQAVPVALITASGQPPTSHGYTFTVSKCNTHKSHYCVSVSDQKIKLMKR